MKKYFMYSIYTLLLCAIACACSDNLDIRRDYEFQITHLPVKEEISLNETVELRFQLTKEGNYEKVNYYVRYFQSSGEGELMLEDGTMLVSNEEHLLESEAFFLYYTSRCTEQQTINLYITDSFGKTVELSFSFRNKDLPTEEPIDFSFDFVTLPVPGEVLLNDTVEIRCEIAKNDERNGSTYSIRYFQSSGKGKLLLGNTVMSPNDLYPLSDPDFQLHYVSESEERQVIDVYIVDDKGTIVSKTFTFENVYIEPEPEIDLSFTFETLPVLSSIGTDETIEIRCKIKKTDDRNASNYFIRYFQPSGKGELANANGVVFVPNDLYHLSNMEFRLYYTSRCAELQTIDIYIEDAHGQVIQKTFSWQNAKGDDDEKEKTE